MSYGDLATQLKGRGASEISRSTAEKATYFYFEGRSWLCPDTNRSAMTGELADGYELLYCIKLYCTPRA